MVKLGSQVCHFTWLSKQQWNCASPCFDSICYSDNCFDIWFTTVKTSQQSQTESSKCLSSFILTFSAMTITNNDKQIPYRCEPNPASIKTTKRDSKVRDDIVFQDRKSRLQHLKVFTVRWSRREDSKEWAGFTILSKKFTISKREKENFKKYFFRLPVCSSTLFMREIQNRKISLWLQIFCPCLRVSGAMNSYVYE